MCRVSLLSLVSWLEFGFGSMMVDVRWVGSLWVNGLLSECPDFISSASRVVATQGDLVHAWVSPFPPHADDHGWVGGAVHGSSLWKSVSFSCKVNRISWASSLPIGFELNWFDFFGFSLTLVPLGGDSKEQTHSDCSDAQGVCRKVWVASSSDPQLPASVACQGAESSGTTTPQTNHNYSSLRQS